MEGKKYSIITIGREYCSSIMCCGWTYAYYAFTCD